MGEDLVVTTATCHIAEGGGSGYCLGDGGSELPGTVQRILPLTNSCFYSIESNRVEAFSGSGGTCKVDVTSCVAGKDHIFFEQYI